MEISTNDMNILNFNIFLFLQHKFFLTSYIETALYSFMSLLYTIMLKLYLLKRDQQTLVVNIFETKFDSSQSRRMTNIL